jgi:hypothetical protein
MIIISNHMKNRQRIKNIFTIVAMVFVVIVLFGVTPAKAVGLSGCCYWITRFSNGSPTTINFIDKTQSDCTTHVVQVEDMAKKLSNFASFESNWYSGNCIDFSQNKLTDLQKKEGIYVPPTPPAADPTGCCRWEDDMGIGMGWRSHADVLTKTKCDAKENLSSGIDVLYFLKDGVAKSDSKYVWCELSDPSKDQSGCCQWDEDQNVALPGPFSTMAGDMKKSKCDSMRGYKTDNVVFYLGGKASYPGGKQGIIPFFGGRCSSSTNSSTSTPASNSTPTQQATPTFGNTVFTVTNPLGTDDISVLIGRIIKALLGIIGSLALIMFVAGGLMWMTSAGNEKQVSAGKNTIVWAAVGLIVVFFSYVLVKFVLEAIGS